MFLGLKGKLDWNEHSKEALGLIAKLEAKSPANVIYGYSFVFENFCVKNAFVKDGVIDLEPIYGCLENCKESSFVNMVVERMMSELETVYENMTDEQKERLRILKAKNIINS